MFIIIASDISDFCFFAKLSEVLSPSIVEHVNMKLGGRIVDICRRKCCGPNHQEWLVIGWNKNIHVGPLVYIGWQYGRGSVQRADGLNVAEVQDGEGIDLSRQQNQHKGKIDFAELLA